MTAVFKEQQSFENIIEEINNAIKETNVDILQNDKNQLILVPHDVAIITGDYETQIYGTETTDQTASDTEIYTSQDHETTRFRYCPNCGADVDTYQQSLQFCPECGTDFSTY